MEVVAVYGTLRQGECNHYLLRGAQHLCDGTVPGLALYAHVCEVFPIAVIDKKARTRVEVYLVPPDVLFRLDRLEGHPDWYRRERMPVHTEGRQGVKVCKAWVYVMTDVREPLGPPIPDGDWVCWRHAGRRSADGALLSEKKLAQTQKGLT